MLFMPKFPSPGRMCFTQYQDLESVGTGLSLDLDIERDILRLLLKPTYLQVVPELNKKFDMTGGLDNGQSTYVLEFTVTIKY